MRGGMFFRDQVTRWQRVHNFQMEWNPGVWEWPQNTTSYGLIAWSLDDIKVDLNLSHYDFQRKRPRNEPRPQVDFTPLL